MFNGRFYLGWILSAMFMYIAFYLFHGVITNDILKLTIPKTLFLSVAAIVYLIVAFGMSLLFRSTSLKKNIRNPFRRSLLIGILTALFMYGVAFTVGISFSFKVTMFNLLIDVGWQLIEQSLGAFFVALANTLFYREEEEHANFL
jgi:predicted neutral ceramidase superfamily lipid hydrolase